MEPGTQRPETIPERVREALAWYRREGGREWLSLVGWLLLFALVLAANLLVTDRGLAEALVGEPWRKVLAVAIFAALGIVVTRSTLVDGAPRAVARGVITGAWVFAVFLVLFSFPESARRDVPLAAGLLLVVNVALSYERTWRWLRGAVVGLALAGLCVWVYLRAT